MVSWTKGRHFVKAGINIPTFSRLTSDDRANFGGTYYFSSLEDFELGRPFSFSQNEGDSSLSFWYREIGAFIQDDMRLRPNLSIGLGLRYERQNFVDKHNSFAPRFSFAYAPGRQRKTVIRGGAGFFYDRTGHQPIADVLRFDGQRLRRIDITDPGHPHPLTGAGTIVEAPSSVVTFARDVRAPYNLHYTLGVERQATKSTKLTATYAGIRGSVCIALGTSMPPFHLSIWDDPIRL